MGILPIMFAFCFSILALAPRGKSAKASDPVNYTGILYAGLAMVLWWISGSIWPVLATTEMFVPLAWLWFGLGFIFLAVFFTFNILVIRAAIHAKQPGQLEIRERDEEY